MHHYKDELHRAVEAFKKYQAERFPDITEENDNGEWESGAEFDAMCSAYMGVLENVLAGDADDELLEEMLYAIARDNECSYLIAETVGDPDWFDILCRYSIETKYMNAKWQFAGYLYKYEGKEETRRLIFRFLESGEEYTERIALQSLAEMYPDKVEEYALRFWNQNKYEADEYQKLMVLGVLNRIGSPLLESCLAEAEKTEYYYLKSYAEKLKKELSGFG